MKIYAQVDLASNKGVNFADPTVAQDAATKQYVDDQSGGTAILSGTATPDDATGSVGEYYLDTDDQILYGPKAMPGVSGSAHTSQVPGSDASINNREAGVRFTLATAGTITAVRYYRSAASGQTSRTLRVWDFIGGTLLTSESTTDETGTGWFTVDLTTPVVVTADQQVVVSFTGAGQCPVGVSNLPITNGSITATQGVYGDPGGVYPNTTWVLDAFTDVVFNAAPTWPVALTSAVPESTVDDSTDYGNLSNAQNSRSSAFGAQAVAGMDSVAIGYSADAAQNAIAIGVGAIATGFTGMAIGKDADASASFALSIGNGAVASGQYSIAIGSATTTATAQSSISINGTATATNSIALIGYAEGEYSVAIGQGSMTVGLGNVAVGINSATGFDVTHEYAVAIGGSASAMEIDATSLGHSASAQGARSVALGPGATASNADEFVLGTTTHKLIVPGTSEHTFFGPIALPANPTTNLQAATKQYVDNRTPQVTVSTTAPGSPAVGDVWIDTN